MVKVDKGSVHLGFWIAGGFFLFGLVLAVLMWVLNKAKGAAGGQRNG